MADYLDDPRYGIGRVVEARHKTIYIEFPALGNEQKKFKYDIVKSRIVPSSDFQKKKYQDEVEKYVRTLNERFKSRLKERPNEWLVETDIWMLIAKTLKQKVSTS